MSWLRLDDDMLDHPKWVRAIRDGGSGALHLWVALCSWCSRHLTDGEVPADIVPTLTPQWRNRDRAKAMQALESSQLVTITEPGAVHIVDYLERNPSRAETIERRDRQARHQRNHVVKKKLSAQHPLYESAQREHTELLPIPSRPVPSRPLSQKREGESAREPEVKSDPEVKTDIRTLPPSKREQAREAEAARLGTTPAIPHRFDPKWDPNDEHRARGHELGLSDAQILEEAEDCRLKIYPHGFSTEDDQFFRELKWLATDLEKKRFQEMNRNGRDKFENPGRDRGRSAG